MPDTAFLQQPSENSTAWTPDTKRPASLARFAGQFTFLRLTNAHSPTLPNLVAGSPTGRLSFLSATGKKLRRVSRHISLKYNLRWGQRIPSQLVGNERRVAGDARTVDIAASPLQSHAGPRKTTPRNRELPANPQQRAEDPDIRIQTTKGAKSLFLWDLSSVLQSWDGWPPNSRLKRLFVRGKYFLIQFEGPKQGPKRYGFL